MLYIYDYFLICSSVGERLYNRVRPKQGNDRGLNFEEFAEKQEAWLQKYAKIDLEYDKNGRPNGVVEVFDKNGRPDGNGVTQKQFAAMVELAEEDAKAIEKGLNRFEQALKKDLNAQPLPDGKNGGAETSVASHYLCDAAEILWDVLRMNSIAEGLRPNSPELLNKWKERSKMARDFYEQLEGFAVAFDDGRAKYDEEFDRQLKLHKGDKDVARRKANYWLSNVTQQKGALICLRNKRTVEPAALFSYYGYKDGPLPRDLFGAGISPEDLGLPGTEQESIEAENMLVLGAKNKSSKKTGASVLMLRKSKDESDGGAKKRKIVADSKTGVDVQIKELDFEIEKTDER